VMRWAPKYQEVYQALDPAAGRLLNWIGDDGNSAQVLRRLTEVVTADRLRATYAEQFWAYRASLREQLTTENKAPVRQVSAVASGRPKLHPEDRRRVAYLAALGKAAASRSAAQIEFLESFELPYDPLISYFVHQEVAELSLKSEELDFAGQLRHRLHAIWFSSPRDSSLRNVVEAMRVVREHPEAAADAQARFDELNALAQALAQRWEVRNGTKPKSAQAVIRDIDTTVIEAEKTFAALESLARECGIPAEQWQARRQALERTLIRPIGAYRSDLLPQVGKEKTRDVVDDEDER
jgi:hypothetical protein